MSEREGITLVAFIFPMHNRNFVFNIRPPLLYLLNQEAETDKYLAVKLRLIFPGENMFVFNYFEPSSVTPIRIQKILLQKNTRAGSDENT